MTDNKLFNLFNNLTGIEKKEVIKMLKSPFFNQKEDLIRLWEWINDVKKRKKKGISSMEEAYKAVYPNEKFNPAKSRHLQSQLVALLEKLLVQRAIQRKPLLSDLQLASIYKQKGLPLKPVFRRADGHLAKLPQNLEYYHAQYQLQWEKYASIESSERTGKKNLAVIEASLDIYLLSSKLRLACLMESHRAVSNVDYDNTFLMLLLNHIEENHLLETPIISLYYYCYKSLTVGAESDFRAFRETLKQQQQKIHTEERTTFLLLAINYCIKQLNTGEVRYLQEALDLYQTGLDTEILITDGYLSRFAFKNIVALALKLDRFNWVKTFIDQYTPLLKSTYQESNRNYNLARLYFAKKEFKKAMPMLAQVDDSDLLLNLDSRVMLIKMYYEMGEYDALDNLLSSFRILLLRKKKVIGYHQSHYLNMLRYTKKMMKLNPYDREAVSAFREEVNGNSGVIEKEWILEMIG